MTQPRALPRRSVAPSDRSAVLVRDAGIGLIEIVISMFLISLLAIAFIPVLISALRASELNSTVATATRLVAQAIDTARTSGVSTCALAQSTLPGFTDVVDAQGVTLRVVTTVPLGSNCVDRATMLVTVVAYDLSDPARTPIADARTLIYLDGTP
jgi:Tfp pilus assembly protein PilV